MNNISVLEPEVVRELILSNNAIRSPVYVSDKPAGQDRQWGADIIPALLDIFHLVKKPDHENTWVGFAMHWKGEIFKLEFKIHTNTDNGKTSDQVLMLTAVSGTEIQDKEKSIVDEDYGTIKLISQIPTEKEWNKRYRQFQNKRKDNDNNSLAVKAFIDELPEWKKSLAKKFDHLVESQVPNVQRAIKWHVPFYGIEDNGYFVQFSVLSKKIKITFLRGTSLKPEPPIVIRNQEGRSVEYTNDAELNDQMKSWIIQASQLPGMFT